jgi:hypothetical protein
MNDASSAAAGGDAPRWSRNRVLAIVAAVVVAIAAVVLVVVLVSGGSDNKSSTTKKASPTTTSRNDTITVPLGPVSSDSAGPPVNVSPVQAQQIVNTLQKYVKDATVQPLRNGALGADLPTLFDQGTLAQVSGADRRVVLDEGLPQVTGDLTATAQPVPIVGLGDQGGALVLVTATLDLNVSGTTTSHGDPLRIGRKAEFVLAPGPYGSWQITSYRMVVVRTGGGLDTTTTTKAASKGTP